MNPLIFNFHQLLHLEVWSDDERVRRFYSCEYRHHMVQDEHPHQAIVKLFLNSDQHPIPEPSFRHQHKILARWQHAIILRENHIEILASGNSFAIPMIHHMLVHPSLRYLSTQLGVIMLHASAVAHKGKSLIFASKPGIGKTTINAILLSDKGTYWQPHADDYVFLTPQPQSLAYLTRPHLYQPTIKWVPKIAKSLTAWQRTKIRSFSLLRRLSRSRIKWPLRVETLQTLPKLKLCPQAVPSGLVLLHTSQEKKPNCQLITNMNSALDNLVTINFAEAKHFIRLMSESQANIEEKVIAWKEEERKLLKSIIEQVPLYEFWMPDNDKANQSSKKEISALASKIVENNSL